jgi:hypothetical protein
MFTPEEQAQIDALMAEAKEVPKNGLLEEGYGFARPLTDAESRLFTRYLAEKHGIVLSSTRVEFTRDAEHRLPRMFGKDG